MCKKVIYLIPFVLMLGSVSNAEDIQWTDLGADHLWSTPENWDLGRVPTLADDVRIDVPAAGAPNGPVIQDGIDAKANGIFTEAAGEPTLTMTGGTLEVADWIWWGDGENSFGIWEMSGGTVSVVNEFELGWGGGAGTLTMTGGTINAGEAVIPTDSGAFGELYLYGGTYNVTTAGGLSMEENGMIDITEGTLVLEGDDTAKVNDLIAAGLITAYGGDGQLELDFDVRNPGKTTLTATIEKTVLFEEDFEGLALGPNVDEALAGDAVWTDTPPEGWSIDESGIPGINLDATDGVTEWAGWAFTDKEWWIAAAEDQDRSLFELGSGTVAVADPDEWDDAERLPIPISADPYDTWLTTPEINIASAEAGTLELKFDSSWRPEFDDNYHQTANITASFDGGDPIEVMLWESDEASANFHPYATNETVIVKLDNPEGAKKLVLTFGLFDAGNDWWWAIDNLEIRGVVPYLGPVNPGTEGLAAYYPFENDVLDASGNGNDGTIVGDPVFVDGPPGYGMAMEFDGIDDYVDCGNAESLDITGDITVACWIKVAAFSKTWETILAKGDHAYRMSRGPGDGDSIHFGCNGPSGGNLNASTIVTTDTWRHVALVYDGTDKIIYIDGVEDARLASEGSIESHDEHNLFIGENSEAVNRFLTGLVDEVMIYNRALSEAEIRYLAGERAIPVNPGNVGLIAHWAFDEGEGDIANDSSGNDNHGTIVGTGTEWVAGRINGALSFIDGAGYVEVPDNPTLNTTDEITIAAWVNPTWTGNNRVLQKGASDNQYRLLREWGDSLFLDLDGVTNGRLEASPCPPDNEWHHVAGTYNGLSMKIYYDGELVAQQEASGAIATSSDSLFIGTKHATAPPQDYFYGILDEVYFFNRALPAGEVRYLAGYRPMVDPGTDALVAYYEFENDVLDSSGNGNDGTVNGNPTFVDGMIGTALEFDGDGDYIDCGNNPILAITDAVSISAWIKVAAQGLDHKVGGNQDGANGGYKMTVFNNNKVEFEIRTAANSAVLNRNVAGGTEIKVDVWYHVTGVYSLADGYIRTYVDGELDRELETTQALGASPGSLMIGCEPFSTGQYNFNGVMDDIRVYSKALSEAEARYLANN